MGAIFTFTTLKCIYSYLNSEKDLLFRLYMSLTGLTAKCHLFIGLCVLCCLHFYRFYSLEFLSINVVIMHMQSVPRHEKISFSVFNEAILTPACSATETS